MKHVEYKKLNPLGLSKSVAGTSSSRSDDQSIGLVSCLMVTRGNPALIRSALAAFLAQTWRRKELIIVCDQVMPALRDLLRPWAENGVTLVEVPLGLKLGDLRNIAIGHSRGEFICQWDDDDLYDPERIRVSMKVMSDGMVDAVFLTRWLIWWPSKNELVVSESRIWEGSMIARRSVIPVYPSLSRAEDSAVVNWILERNSVALVDMPTLYCYRVTGENTWDSSHFNNFIAKATKKYSPAEQEVLFELPCFSFSNWQKPAGATA